MMRVSNEHAARIILRHLPPGWALKQSRRRNKSLTGVACPKDMVIRTPFLRDVAAIYIFLHECAHVHLGHFRGDRHPHIEEYEAELTAFHLMRLEGFRVPREIALRARDYVAWHVEQGEARGEHISSRVRRWCGGKRDGNGAH